MKITSAKYFQHDTSENVGVYATIDGIEMSVPIEPANRHYQAILEWAEEDGNTIQEAD
tara:strand:- start:260 stop:433 length:174 start_codon:yes stop_codon:yes gene_type:complete